VELISFAVLLFLMLRKEQDLSVADLVMFYAVHQLVKSVIYRVLYGAFFRFSTFKLNATLLLVSLPFFLMGCAGFLQSKVDLYLFGFFHEAALLGEYQIISGFFIFSQSIATILLLPYLKNIYRMKAVSILSLKNRMIWLGLFLNIIVVAVIFFALKLFFDIELTVFELIAGFFIGWPSYVYAMHIFYLFKNNQERQVLIISVVSLCFNFILSLVLLSLDVAVLGVLIANSIAQIVALTLYLRKKIDDDIFKKAK
jgi:O-antigen/teichoic acid export membrane protein